MELRVEKVGNCLTMSIAQLSRVFLYAGFATNVALN